MIRVGLPLLLLMSLAACGSDRAAQPSTAPSSTAPSSTSTSAVASSTSAVAAVQASTTSTTRLPSTSASSVAPGCRPLADLDTDEELFRWQVVNDGVMGGRSSADASVADSVLVLVGEIVTDGGGFSSVRLALDEPLGEATGLALRVRTDGRPYELTVSDAAAGRDRRVSHQAPIAAIGDGGWEEVAVDFSDLEASVFGRAVDVDPFDPGAAIEVGIILADGSDGPFRFELDWIRICP